MDPLDAKTMELSSGAPHAAGDGTHYLVVVEGEQPGTRREIRSSMTLGRDTSCYLRFTDAGVSKFHCRLRSDGSRITVTDLGSTNGTFVDGRRIEDGVELGVEALLQVGSQVLRHEFRSRAEVERAAQLAHDLEKARAYVGALIPAPIESGPLRTDWSFMPSAVLGGDLLGTHALDATHQAFYLLDVCGHGVGAAMHSASVFNVLRNQTLPATDFRQPSEVLTRLNESFPMESHGGMYLTLWYGVYDCGTRTLEFASAGHPPALLKAQSGEALRRLQTRNPPIGALEGRRFAQDRTDTRPGDRLYLFSDGAFEIVDRAGRPWALEDLERLVREPARPGLAESERLRCAVQGTARDASLEDDFSLMVVSFE